MVDDRREDSGPPDLGRPDLGRPRRAPPTIDLAATEVTSATAAGSDSAEAPAETPVEPQLEPTSESPGDAPAESAAEAAAAAPAAPPPPKPSAALAAGSGALAAAVVVGIAWFAGWQAAPTAPETPQAGSMALEALSARIARVESRPAPSAATNAAAAPDPALAARLETLEKSVTALRGDLAAARTQSERAAAAVAELKSAPPTAAAAVNLAPINDRLGQIERAAAALKAETAQQSARPADDRPLRRVVAASLLDGTVRQSEPYAAQLGAAKPLADDANALKPLEAFAASGLPTVATLSRELLAVLPKLTATADAAPTTGMGFVDRLQAGAARLVRIQRTDAVTGDDRNAIVSRATAAALRNDVALARREVGALQPADRGAVQAWIDKVDARDAALAASRQFAADAMAALNKPAP
jgi:hypothetical protein